ncbi:hypothetical protein GIB67_026449 [Kingdonia uniflora]|uniref:PGG domain-containing protein n=1 Tax=Kingdonia uniflora TaxID=39325 RepID=A0A7J7P6A7_9MAGN|nr:hypothetical protein GIB67_026449 [Kingdonia uniflora]
MASSSAQNILNRDLSCYTPLYKAAFEGNWEAALTFLNSDPNAMSAAISGSGKTALHIAAISGQTSFVEKLVELESVPSDALERKDNGGHTAFYFAVAAGNFDAVKAMLRKNSGLPQIRNCKKQAPILEAALLGHKELLLHLCDTTKDVPPSPFRGKDGVTLLNAIISAEFFDIALCLVQRYPEVATTRDGHNLSALDILARRASSFTSGSKLGFWGRRLYPFFHVPHSSTPIQPTIRDLENQRPPSVPEETQESSIHIETQASTQALTNVAQVDSTSSTHQVFGRLTSLIWDTTTYLVPIIKDVYDTKLMHNHAVELVDCICQEITILGNQAKITELVNIPFMKSAEYGTVELMDTCLKYFPQLIWIHYNDCHTVLHLCITHRQEKIFKLLHKMKACQNSLAAFQDPCGNNILHLAANVAPPEKLKATSGAALQMQRELQWYKAVEKITKPTYRDLRNKKEETPRAIFIREHEKLVENGEKWMKDLASSCSVVALLIATMVFAAAFTVPGGNSQDEGIPIFLKSNCFMVFAISNALALNSSLTSVLIFLSVLTSRYAEDDFLDSLPKKLIIGLATLFFSIATMTIAFSTTYFIMFTNHLGWVPVLLASLISLPAILFVRLQFPLFIIILQSTYGTDVLYRQR